MTDGSLPFRCRSFHMTDEDGRRYWGPRGEVGGGRATIPAWVRLAGTCLVGPGGGSLETGRPRRERAVECAVGHAEGAAREPALRAAPAAPFACLRSCELRQRASAPRAIGGSAAAARPGWGSRTRRARAGMTLDQR